MAGPLEFIYEPYIRYLRSRSVGLLGTQMNKILDLKSNFRSSKIAIQVVQKNCLISSVR